MKHMSHYLQRYEDDELTEEDKQEILEHPARDRNARLQEIAAEIEQQSD